MNDAIQPSWQELLDLVTQLNDGNYESVAMSFGTVSIRLSKSGDLEPDAGVAVVAVAATPAAVPVVVAPAKAPAPVADPAPVPVAEVRTGTAITATMLGVFYRRPSPGSAPFVEPGQTVDADTTVGIIEIMKLMNPVVAGVAGVITGFEVTDGEFVQFGQVLARLEPTAN